MSEVRDDLEECNDERRLIYRMVWKVYIIECRNGELYVGTSKDISRRIEQHNKGIACRYTSYRGPVKLIYEEVAKNYLDARKRERQIKKYSRAKKLALSK